VKQSAVRITARALKPLVSGLQALGHDPGTILEDAGLSESSLDDPDGWLPGNAGATLLSTAARATGDENIGLHLALHADLRTLDVLYYALANSATLADGYAALARYQRLIHEGSTVQIDRYPGGALMRHAFAGGFPAPRYAADFILTAWVRAGRHITGVGWTPAEVRFAHAAAADIEDHERFFGAPLRFSCGENALAVPTAALELPCSDADPVLASVIARHAADRIGEIAGGGSFLARARRELDAQLRTGDPSARSLAARLRISVRTLNRSLADEGTTYRALIEQVRRELAARRLAEGRLSLAEIAFGLGFSDLTAFHRAFKRWTGRTPGEYRRSIVRPG